MAIAHYFAGDSICTTNTGLSDGGTLALTGAGPGRAQQLWGVMIKALGTITVTDITITKSDGTTAISKIGGTHALQNGGVYSFPAPIIGSPNDNMIVNANLTGATAASVGITAVYTIANC